jgi:hypothetical protein
MFAATVGAGASFGTARECHETLARYGNGKSKRFAEISAAHGNGWRKLAS